VIISGRTIFTVFVILAIPSTVAIGIYTLNFLNQSDQANLSNDHLGIQQILLNESIFKSAPRDQVTFKGITLDQDRLSLEVSYGGGCKDHIFVLIGSDVFMESHPVQTNIVLSHNANNDMCEALLMKDMVFDLSPLKESYQDAYQASSGTIRIHLEGALEELIYHF
jgi:hypothetical protein